MELAHPHLILSQADRFLDPFGDHPHLSRRGNA